MRKVRLFAISLIPDIELTIDGPVEYNPEEGGGYALAVEELTKPSASQLFLTEEELKWLVQELEEKYKKEEGWRSQKK